MRTRISMAVALAMTMTVALAGPASAATVLTESFTGTAGADIAALGWTTQKGQIDTDNTVIDVSQSGKVTGLGGPNNRDYMVSKDIGSVYPVTAETPAVGTINVKHGPGDKAYLGLRLWAGDVDASDYVTIMLSKQPGLKWMQAIMEVDGDWSRENPWYQGFTWTEGIMKMTTEPNSTLYEFYDPGTSSWTTVGSLPGGLSSVAAVSLLGAHGTGGFFDSLVVDAGEGGPTPVPLQNFDFTWDKTGAGDWNVAGNWDPSSFGAPPGDPTNDFRSHHAATFGSKITANSTVYTDSAVSLRSVSFDNANFSYNVAGAGSVNIIANTNPSPKPTQIAVAAGAHQFQAVVNLGTDTTVDVAGGSTLEFNNRLFLNSNTLTKTGEGTLAISNDVVSGAGTINLQQGTVAGAGTVGGDVNNDGGTVSPGNQGLSANNVPEPATWMMLALGAIGCLAWTRKHRRR